jgi:hypothetical protein
LDGFELAALDLIGGLTQPDAVYQRRVTVTLDSGAAVNVIPRGLAEGPAKEDGETGRFYVTADGGRVQDAGRVKVQAVNDLWEKLRKPLVAASQVCKAGKLHRQQTDGEEDPRLRAEWRLPL